MVMTLDIAEKVARRKGWRINPDRAHAQEVIDGLNILKKKKGRYYCPCKVVTGDPDRDRKVICPCADAQSEIDANGVCHCGLYAKAK